MDSNINIRELKRSLPGRFILKIFKEITRVPNKTPSTSQFKEYVEKRPDIDSMHYYCKLSMLQIGAISSTLYKTLSIPIDINDLLWELAEKPLSNAIAILIRGCPTPYPDEILFWVYSQEVEGTSEFEYTIFGFDESGPEEILIHMEVIASKEIIGENFLGLTDNFRSETKDIDFNLCVAVLNHILKKPVGAFNNFPGGSEAGFAPHTNPPRDQFLIDQLTLLNKGKIKCIKGLVDFELVRPFSYDFCINYPDKYIPHTHSVVSKIIDFGLLVYEKEGILIMSDNYPSYLALKKQGIKKVKVVILGETKIAVEESRIGGEEMIPPILPLRGSLDNHSEEYKKALLEERILELSKLEKLQKLSSTKSEGMKLKLKEGKVDEVLDDLLILITHEDIRNEVFLLLGRHSKLKRDSRKGIISKEFETLNYNQILDSMLELLSKIEE